MKLAIPEQERLQGKDVRIRDSWGYVIHVNTQRGEVVLSGWNGFKTTTQKIDLIQQVRLPEDRS